ncbi:MAG TPA: penicillin-binding protein 2 [Caulobacteraceae bacterium]|nr:penicillin-binding protein 2 [Caulobacteraceae bacterium]
MRPSELMFYRLPIGWRWLVESVWKLEHAFERAKAKDQAESDTRIRIFFVLAMFAAGFFTLALGATKCALFSDADRSGLAAAPPSGSRADLVDRNGSLLAVDLTHYGLYIDAREIWDTGETRRVLGKVLPTLNPQRLDHALASDRREYILGGLTPDQKAQLEDLGLPGVSFEEEERRIYPLGSSAAHLIGFSDKGGSGLSGAERALDQSIKSNAGGQPVALAMDVRVQAALDDELTKAVAKYRALGGVGMVVNVKTGEILGFSSQPDFDLNLPGKGTPEQMLNRGATSVYELGSVFKAFTLAAGLDSGVVTLNTSFDVSHPIELGGHLVHDFDKGDSTLQLWQVFTHSSNIGAAKMALMAGPQRMQDYFRRFGLFAAAPGELTESAPPILPRQFSDQTLAQIAFGQGIAVSPLALATGYRSLLDGGVYSPLTIRKQPDGTQPQGRRVISEKTSATMLQLMRLNVTDPKGSGHKADVPGLFVGGKTGSAQKPEHGHYGRNNISSFVAVFPATGPLNADRYMVQITLDSPQVTPDSMGFITGGWNAAPTAGAVIDRIAPFVGVKRAAPSLADVTHGAKDIKPLQDGTTEGALSQ